MIKCCSSLLILIVLLYYTIFQSCDAKHYCTPSTCGIIPNISYPFHLKFKGNDSRNCGDPKYELECENNVTFISLDSHKYYVKAINYTSSSIRLADASLNYNDICSFPNHSAYYNNFTTHDNPYPYPYYPLRDRTTGLTFRNCAHPLKNSSRSIEITSCASNSSLSTGYSYITTGLMKASEVQQMCSVDMMVMTSWKFKDLNNVSLAEIHDALLYGFELDFCSRCGNANSSLWGLFLGILLYGLIPTLLVIVGLLCGMAIPPVTTIIGFATIFGLIVYTAYWIQHIWLGATYTTTVIVTSIVICAPRLVIFVLAVWILIYKFRRRRMSIFEDIESFLQSDNKLTKIRYSYSDIKKMTQGFQDKLGEGGYGTVYKGKLRSSHHVAVKLLRKSGANGQDFMNEISTIGRIHHVNVVKLVGYCAQGSKRALVYDFMPNGSLEKYLFNREKMTSLSCDTKFQIAIGVARGIEYLHRGCDIQILHFDIKPHNILLDDNFIPKISDFGLAKFYSTDKKTVTMTTVRGTIGYVAPELISRSIGAVSYKADVYSFGMLLMELVGLNKNLRGDNANSSKYFPYWIYDCFEQGQDIEIGKAEENEDIDENDSSNKVVVRKMTIVSLWCIQMTPDDRPSMNKVLQMLEGDVEHLQIPDYPSQSTHIEENVDETGITYSSDSISLLHREDASRCVEIIAQV